MSTHGRSAAHPRRTADLDEFIPGAGESCSQFTKTTEKVRERAGDAPRWPERYLNGPFKGNRGNRLAKRSRRGGGHRHETNWCGIARMTSEASEEG